METSVEDFLGFRYRVQKEGKKLGNEADDPSGTSIVKSESFLKTDELLQQNDRGLILGLPIRLRSWNWRARRRCTFRCLSLYRVCSQVCTLSTCRVLECFGSCGLPHELPRDGRVARGSYGR